MPARPEYPRAAKHSNHCPLRMGSIRRQGVRLIQNLSEA